jgi:uncharacterized membrane protein YbhN (UPF0104 family)
VDVSRPRFTVAPLEAPPMELPEEADPRRIGRKAATAVALLATMLLVVVLAPGLDAVRNEIANAKPGWIALAVFLEFLSCWSYVLMFRPVFCDRMTWRTASELAWSELGMGSIVPASGAGGLALGAWALSRGGMPGDVIARRSVAFFVIKSSVNFVAVAVIGTAMALGVGPHQSLWLTAVPAIAAVLAVAAVVGLARLSEGEMALAGSGRAGRALRSVRRALIGGLREAAAILREGDPLVFLGAIGYWAFDNAVLWATFHAIGISPPLTVILMAYLIGQLGGALPLPGGIGGIDGGLLGTLVVYGVEAAPAAAAVLTYRVILFWLPLMFGALAFVSLRRGMNDPDRPDLCVTVRGSPTAAQAS